MIENKIKLAILDMNNDAPNQGMRCIREIVSCFEDELDYDVFNVRGQNEIPDLSYDIFISSGGPGSPLEEGEWRAPYFELVDAVWNFNLEHAEEKKHFFFICYSFQIMCHHLKLGEINRRKKTSFGIYPIHKTFSGMKDPLLRALPNPYHGVDSRDWQLVQPKLNVFKKHGANILSLEKIRTHVEYERAIMAVRFSDEFVGTQFHPEADPEGMAAHFSKKENRDKIIENFDEQKYIDMMTHLEDPDKIALTHSVILPGFIRTALNKLSLSPVLS